MAEGLFLGLRVPDPGRRILASRMNHLGVPAEPDGRRGEAAHPSLR